MHRASILIVLGLSTSILAFSTYQGLSTRLAQLERAPRVDPEELRKLRLQISADEDRVAAALKELDRLRSTPERTAKLDACLSALTVELDEAACALRSQDARLAEWERVKNEFGPNALDARLREYRDGVEDRFRRVDEVTQTALGLAKGVQTEIARVESGLERDGQRMWNDLVGPTVQLMGDETVGSGVLLASEPLPEGDEWRTYLITAWHVIRDIQAGPENAHVPIPVTIFRPDKTTQPETAELLQFDAGLDVALLRLNTTRRIECGARLAPRERLGRARIFDRIYAVGCPLGNDPIPTYGEISDTAHAVDGQHYWMISAPTYIGNSGGGIFDARTHELLAIFSKIYTHGSVRPTVVPHMGLATSMLAVYDWLEKVGYAGLEPRPEDVQAQTASAQR
jgi:S1-C subfamily serine protease